MKKFLSLLLAVMMVLSTVSFAAPSAFTAVDSAVTLPVEEVAFEEAELSALIADKTSPVNGILMFEMNFDDVPVGAYVDKSTAATLGWANPDFPAAAGSFLKNDAGFTAEIVKSDDASRGNYLSYTGKSGYSMFSINRDANEASFSHLDGYHVLTFDVLNLSTNSVTKTHTIRFTAAAQYAEDVPTEYYSTVKDAWGEYRAVYDAKTIGTSNHARKIESITEIGNIKLHGAGIAATDVFGIDNIRLYYIPKSVNVTVKGGVNKDFETVTVSVSPTATIDEIIAALPGSVSDFGKVTGLADSFGKKITSFSSFENVTLEALWSPWIVLEGSQEFAVDKKGGWSQAGLYSLSVGAPVDVGNGGGELTTAALWMFNNGHQTTGGNLIRTQKTPAMGDAKNGTLSTPMGWSIPAVRSISGDVRDTVHTTLPAGNDAEYIIVKYKFDNLPDLASLVANCPNPEDKKYTLSEDGLTINYYDRNGAAASASLRPEYIARYFVHRPTGSYEYAGGYTLHQNEKFVEDVWYYDVIPSTARITADGVDNVIVQRANLFDGMVTEYDYVRFVKLGDELAPAKKVILTIENNLNDLLDASYKVAVEGSVSLSELEKVIEAGKDKYELVGFSFEEAGEIIPGDSFILVEDTTIYPVWREYNVVYALEFNDTQAGVNELKANTNFAWNSYGQNVTSETNRFGKTVDGIIYGNIKRVNGYETFTMKAPDTHTGIDGTRWMYGTTQNGDGMLQDMNITAGKVKKIMTKVRYRNVPDFSSCSGDGVSDDKMSHTVSNVSVDTVDGTFSMKDTVLVEFNSQFVGGSWSGALQLKGDIEEAKWVTGEIDVTTNAGFAGKTLYGLHVDPTPFMWDGMVMEIDYIRLLGESNGAIVKPEAPAPEYAPASEAEASYRASAPAGIRFKASITAETDAVATEYGWVVARDVKIKAANMTYADVVIGQTAFKVTVAYGRENGVNLKNFFESNDTTRWFTGVVYNIPANMNDDVLVVVPFVKVGGEYFYGTPVAKSVNEVKGNA